jgi:hypothetical protein
MTTNFRPTNTTKPAYSAKQKTAEKGPEAKTLLMFTALEGQFGEYGVGSLTMEELDVFGNTIADAIQDSKVGKAYITVAKMVSGSGKPFFALKVKPSSK